MHCGRRPKTIAGWWLAAVTVLQALCAQADSWTYWSTVADPVALTRSARAHIGTDGTNFYYASLVDGIFVADVTNRSFVPMPTNGLPLCSPANTNGLAVFHLGVTPSGTVLIGTHPSILTIGTNSTGIAEQSTPNTVPLIYYFDTVSNQWQAASITGNDYPYTQYSGDFAFAADGSIWTCSGFVPYVYHSTDGGHSYTAINLDERVPTNYFDPVAGETSLGRVFGVIVGPGNELIAGTETAGFLHSTDGGQTWASLDPDFADTNSVNPLGRIGNAAYGGVDRFGNILCVASEYLQFPNIDLWGGLPLIGYTPPTGAYFNASGGMPSYSVTPFRIYTTPSGYSFTEMDQSGLGDGGVYRSTDGQNWAQFNTGIPLLDIAHSATNAAPGFFVDEGDCMAMIGNQMFVADVAMNIWSYDTTPAPITDHPPSAIPQTVTIWQNISTNLTLSGTDADGDPLNYSVVTQPQWGTLSGIPPNVNYTPDLYYYGNDYFQFVVDDGQATSTVATVSIEVNVLGDTAPSVTLLNPANLSTVVAPGSIAALAVASDPAGIQEVDFWDGTNSCGAVSNAPYSFTYTNLASGTHTVAALAVNSEGGASWSAPVVVVAVGAPLQLAINTAPSNQFNITWPLKITGALIESAASLIGPWSLVTNAPLDFNYSQHSVTLGTTPPAEFFRLFLAP